MIVNRRVRVLLLLVLCSSWGVASTVIHALETAGPTKAIAEEIDIKRAVELALEAVKERRIAWTMGCDIRVRRADAEWRVYLEPIPMGPGLDVMVIVHSDGSTTIAPGY